MTFQFCPCPLNYMDVIIIVLRWPNEKEGEWIASEILTITSACEYMKHLKLIYQIRNFFEGLRDRTILLTQLFEQLT
jgi:hypothetical protein